MPVTRFELERRQPVGEHRACVDANPIPTDHRLPAGRVPMHHDLAEVRVRLEEGRAYPNQIVRVLRSSGTPGRTPAWTKR